MPLNRSIVAVFFLILIGLSHHAEALDCTVNNIPHNYVTIKLDVYDTDNSTTTNLQLYNAKDATISASYKYASISNSNYYNRQLIFKKIDEKTEETKVAPFYYNFTINLLCNNGKNVYIFTTVPLIDTNNHDPFFDKPKYTYNLISNHAEDFIRQQTLSPISATDYDVTNEGMTFTIEPNAYFDIEYNGLVPHSLRKKHNALLVPKNPATPITKVTDVVITVTDRGYPPRSNQTRIVVYPPSPPTPKFSKTYYEGNYYKNHTFLMTDEIRLEEGTSFYPTTVKIFEGNEQTYYFSTEISDQIFIKLVRQLDINKFFRHMYYVYRLQATYTDKITGLASSGTATFILGLHHDL